MKYLLLLATALLVGILGGWVLESQAAVLGCVPKAWCITAKEDCDANELPKLNGCRNYPPGDNCPKRTCLRCDDEANPANVHYCIYDEDHDDGCEYEALRSCGTMKKRYCTIVTPPSGDECRCPAEGGTSMGQCKVMVCDPENQPPHE